MSHLVDKDDLWPRFESLFIDHYCPDFWSIDDVDLPYGRVMVIDPNDMPTMLWRADLPKQSDFSSVLKDVTQIENKYGIPVGFSISSSWSGDVNAFKEFIKGSGFRLVSRFNWLSKNIANIEVEPGASGFVIEKTKDVHSFAEIMRIGFSNDIGDIFLKGAIENIDDTARGYFIAKDFESGKVVGCAAAYYNDGCAYMSCLAVRPEYRRQGVAKDLVKARIQFLKDNDAKYIVTAVNETNQGSMKVQQNAGYIPCEVTEYWMKV